MRELLMRARVSGVAASLLRALLLGTVLAVAPLSAEATSLAALSETQMTDASDLVVRGTVTSVRTERDSRGWVWTVTEIKVLRAYKGTAPATVVVRTPGGITADHAMLVDGMPRYSVDEDVVMFLSARASGDYLAVGGWQGKYTVRPDPVDGSPLVVRFTVPVTQVYDARFIPVPPRESRLLLSSLETRVEDRVELGWDGEPIPGVSSDRLRVINRLQPGVK